MLKKHTMSFYFFLRYFLSSRSGSLIKLISWLCLGGVIISITALILIVSIMGGFGKAIKTRLLSKQAHLTVNFNQNPFLTKYTAPTQKEGLFFDKASPKSFFPNLSKDQEKVIKKVLVFENQELILKSEKGFKGVSARGYTEYQWNKKLETASTVEDTLIQRKITPDILVPLQPETEKEILLSQELSLETGLSINDIITFVPLTGLLLPLNLPPPVKIFRVKAILQSTKTAEERFSIYYKQGMMNFGDFSKINYKAEIQFYQPEKVKEYERFFKNYNTKTWIEQNSTLFFALKLEKFIMTLFFILALIISCLGISSALLLLMTQKREDIAILQAIGLSQKEVIKTFTKMGLYLSSFGIIIGVCIGLLGTFFLKYNRFNILPKMYQDRTIPAVFMPINYLIIIIGAFILAWFFCYLPSRYLSRIKPVELLKTGHF